MLFRVVSFIFISAVFLLVNRNTTLKHEWRQLLALCYWTKRKNTKTQYQVNCNWNLDAAGHSLVSSEFSSSSVQGPVFRSTPSRPPFSSYLLRAVWCPACNNVSAFFFHVTASLPPLTSIFGSLLPLCVLGCGQEPVCFRNPVL